MATCRVLAVGYDPVLLATRAMVLRQAGYSVKEKNILGAALSEIDSGSIDLVLLCNSIPLNEQHGFVTEALKRRRLLPILSVMPTSYADCVPGSTGVDNAPASLLKAVEQIYKSNSKAL